MEKILSLIFISFILSGCLTNKFAEAERGQESVTVKGFSGIDSIYDLSDVTIGIKWTAGPEIAGYRLYIYIGPTLQDIIDIYNSESYLIEGLASSTTYTLVLNGLDVSGVEINSSPISLTTNLLPDTPELLEMTTPISSTFFQRRPTFKVTGVKDDELVNVYANYNCSGAAYATIEATSDIVTIEPSTDLVPNAYYFSTNTENQVSGLKSACSTSIVFYYLTECPTGYSYVAANSNFGTTGFCVMQYEARAWIDSDSDSIVDSSETVDTDGCKESACTSKDWGIGTYIPGSTSRNRPWRNLSFRSARTACRSLGNKYDLVSNNEWMTIASEIELNTNNWVTTSSGVQCLRSGNTGETSECSFSDTSISANTTNFVSRRLYLANSQVIYDFSGNLVEWSGWYLKYGVEKKVITCNQPLKELNELACSDLGAEEYYPNDANLNSDNYVGTANVISSGYALRGGNLSSQRNAGIYSLNFSSTDVYVPNNVGFRCVYHP